MKAFKELVTLAIAFILCIIITKVTNWAWGGTLAGPSLVFFLFYQNKDRLRKNRNDKVFSMVFFH